MGTKVFRKKELQIAVFLLPNMKDNKKQNSWSAVGFAWELGYSIAIPLVIFTLGGRLLDKKLETSPWLLLVGLFISIIATFWIVYKKLIEIIRNEELEDKSKESNKSS
jgi:F0F1-type ATP synthase assembly protein I